MRYVDKVEKEMALRISLESGLSDPDTRIAGYTGIRPKTMRGLHKHFRETGEVVRKSVVGRLLNSLDGW